MHCAMCIYVYDQAHRHTPRQQQTNWHTHTHKHTYKQTHTQAHSHTHSQWFIFDQPVLGGTSFWFLGGWGLFPGQCAQAGSLLAPPLGSELPANQKKSIMHSLWCHRSSVTDQQSRSTTKIHLHFLKQPLCPHTRTPAPPPPQPKASSFLVRTPKRYILLLGLNGSVKNSLSLWNLGFSC